VTPPYNSTNFVGGNGTRLQHDFIHRLYRWFSPKINDVITLIGNRRFMLFPSISNLFREVLRCAVRTGSPRS